MVMPRKHRTIRLRISLRRFAVLVLAWAVGCLPPGTGMAQEAGQQTTLPPPPPEEPPAGSEPLFKTQVDLVALYVAVLDRDQHLVTGLPRSAFQVFDQGKPQAITEFSNRDIPVSMGIVVDSSASMMDKRVLVNAAALALVRASNPEDEVFILNFKDEAELAQDYTNEIAALERGLSDVQMWGGTAVMDALQTGMEHSQKGTRNKKVLLVITDGEDDASKIQLDPLLALLQKSEVTVYSIGILSQEPTRKRRNAEKMLRAIAKVSGGASYFPGTVEQVEALATQIAHDIRNQ
jgi:VWFA-related protein